MGDSHQEQRAVSPRAVFRVELHAPAHHPSPSTTSNSVGPVKRSVRPPPRSPRLRVNCCCSCEEHVTQRRGGRGELPAAERSGIKGSDSLKHHGEQGTFKGSDPLNPPSRALEVRRRDPCAAANKTSWGCGWRGAARQCPGARPGRQFSAPPRLRVNCSSAAAHGSLRRAVLCLHYR